MNVPNFIDVIQAWRAKGAGRACGPDAQWLEYLLRG